MAKLDALEPEAITLEYVGEFYITCYAATLEQCGSTSGITASGRKVTEDPTCHTVAVDPSVIPLGTYLIIEGYPGIVFRADDTGSAINGYDIDIFTTSESESKTFNNVSGAKVWIIKD
jgi:3D (Asp-Asp-Asp) domain-containing protein